MKRAPLVLAVLLSIPISAPAQTEQTPGSKILVIDCNPHRHTAAESHPWIDPYGMQHYNPTTFPSWDAFLQVTYQNQAPLKATEVDFGLVLAQSLVAVTKDVGDFASGVEIDHEFVLSREIFPLASKPYCAVLRVKYADGSIWQNPAPPEP